MALDAAWVPPLVLLLTLVAQGVWPAARVLCVLSGAGVAALWTALTGRATLAQLLEAVPWDVLVMLVGLGLFSEVMAETRVFGVLAARATRLAGATPARVLLAFCAGMFVVSGVVNNLTALLLVLPVLLVVLQLMAVDRRYTSWILGTMLVACNLGGAATPIGDFPAVLLLSGGRMDFSTYLVAAFPVATTALLLTLVLVYLRRPWTGMPDHPASGPLAVEVMGALYRRVTPRRGLLVACVLILVAMFAAWMLVPLSSGVTPDLVAFFGAMVALWLVPARGEVMLRRRVDVEAALFLMALFLMVGAVRSTGVFADLSRILLGLGLGEAGLRVVLVLAAMGVTAVFSAGPGMAALLEVADAVARQSDSPQVVYVGLAMGVCAGSSMLLTAATSGPLAQSLTERAALRDPNDAPIGFGARDHLAPGMMGAAVTMAVALGYVLLF